LISASLPDGSLQSSNIDHWLKCECGSKITPVFNYQGRTVAMVLVGKFVIVIEKGRYTCPECGRIKRFVSAPIKFV